MCIRDRLWRSLNKENKVSLFVRTVTLETGDYKDVILNKYLSLIHI